MARIEDRIRDHLSENLSILGAELSLIKKEFRLPNPHGAKGFIDILATDSNNHYVIIEIKRSDQSAREALHEIIKYTALLKQKFKVKNSEIRTIILSTEWRELRVPVSELINEATFDIQCYQIYIDESYKIVSKSDIEILEDTATRGLSPKHFAFYCVNREALIKLRGLIEEIIHEIKLNNFLFIEMSTKASKFPNKNCLYFVTNRESSDCYYSLINNMGQSKSTVYLEIIDDYTEGGLIVDDETLTTYLEEQVLTEIINRIYKNKISEFFMESGSPQGFVASLNDWEVRNISRFGFYNKDTRLTDHQIIKETMGLDGLNKYIYFDTFETMSKAKMKEVSEDIKQFLDDSPTWKKEIINMLNDYNGTNCKITMIIQKPKNILETILTLDYANMPTPPFYEVIIDPMNTDESTLEICRGDIGWNGKRVNFNEMLNKFFYNSPINILLFAESANKQLEKYLGIEYITKTNRYSDKGIGLSESTSNNIKPLSDFPKLNSEFIDALHNLHEKVSIRI